MVLPLAFPRGKSHKKSTKKAPPKHPSKARPSAPQSTPRFTLQFCPFCTPRFAPRFVHNFAHNSAPSFCPSFRRAFCPTKRRAKLGAPTSCTVRYPDSDVFMGVFRGCFFLSELLFSCGVVPMWCSQSIRKILLDALIQNPSTTRSRFAIAAVIRESGFRGSFDESGFFESTFLSRF